MLRRKQTRRVKEKRMVTEELSEEAILNPDWKDKERSSYDQNEGKTNIPGNCSSKSLSRNNLSTKLRTERW